MPESAPLTPRPGAATRRRPRSAPPPPGPRPGRPPPPGVGVGVPAGRNRRHRDHGRQGGGGPDQGRGAVFHWITTIPCSRPGPVPTAGGRPLTGSGRPPPPRRRWRSGTARRPRRTGRTRHPLLAQLAGGIRPPPGEFRTGRDGLAGRPVCGKRGLATTGRGVGAQRGRRVGRQSPGAGTRPFGLEPHLATSSRATPPETRAAFPCLALHSAAFLRRSLRRRRVSGLLATARHPEPDGTEAAHELPKVSESRRGAVPGSTGSARAAWRGRCTPPRGDPGCRPDSDNRGNWSRLQPKQ